MQGRMRSGRSLSEESEGDHAIPDPRRAGDRRSDRRCRRNPRARRASQGAARSGSRVRSHPLPRRPRHAGGTGALGSTVDGAPDRGRHRRVVGRADGDARPRDVRAHARGGHRDQELQDALGQRLRDRRPPGPFPALRAPAVGSHAHGADGRHEDDAGADRRSPAGGRRSRPGGRARAGRGAARGRVPPSRPPGREGAGTAPSRSRLGGPAEAPGLREEPPDLVVWRGAVRRGRVSGWSEALLPPHHGRARLPRGGGRPRRLRRRAAIGAVSAVDDRRAGRDPAVPRARTLPRPSPTSSGTRWR